MEQRETAIRTFLAAHFHNHHLKGDEDFFALGFVNSMFAMQLVAFVEKAFKITVDDEDLELDNFRSINALNAFVAGKLAVGETA